MRRLATMFGLLMAGLFATCAATRGADAARKLSISAIMHKQYTVTNAPFLRIKKELNADAPDWAKIQDATRKFASLAEVLGKNEPLDGGSDSWKKLTAQHLETAKALDAAAESRDKTAALASYRQLAASCRTCHSAHRTRDRQ
jgi:hypothetical protein